MSVEFKVIYKCYKFPKDVIPDESYLKFMIDQNHDSNEIELPQYIELDINPHAKQGENVDSLKILYDYLVERINPNCDDVAVFDYFGIDPLH